MKREILFRGKSEYTKDWIQGFLTSKNFINEIKVIPETIGQFTGLIDKNGVKIFEGDKLTDGIIVYVVEYNTQNTSFAINPIERLKTKEYDFQDCIKYDQLGNGYYSRKDLEIIGNIDE